MPGSVPGCSFLLLGAGRASAELAAVYGTLGLLSCGARLSLFAGDVLKIFQPFRCNVAAHSAAGLNQMAAICKAARVSELLNVDEGVTLSAFVGANLQLAHARRVDEYATVIGEHDELSPRRGVTAFGVGLANGSGLEELDAKQAMQNNQLPFDPRSWDVAYTVPMKLERELLTNPFLRADREDLRNRLVSFTAEGSLATTTKALDDAMQRITGLDRGEEGRTGPHPDTFDFVPE